MTNLAELSLIYSIGLQNHIRGLRYLLNLAYGCQQNKGIIYQRYGPIEALMLTPDLKILAGPHE